MSKLVMPAHDVQSSGNKFLRVSHGAKVDLDSKIVSEQSVPLATPAKALHHLALCC